MIIKIKTFEEIRDLTISSISRSNEDNDIFILINKDGLHGSIYPEMIKYFNQELEVEQDINENTFIYKDWIDEESYVEVKIRDWMIQ